MDLKLYQNGEYARQIKVLEDEPTLTELEKLFWISQAQTKSNITNEAVYTGLRMFQNMLLTKDNTERAYYAQMLSTSNVMQAGIRVLQEKHLVKKHVELSIDYFVGKIGKYIEQNNVIVFPAIWPIAFGDTVVFLQWVKHFKETFSCKVIVIIPLNRADLKQLFMCCDWIDEVVDITMCKEEENRNTSLYLVDPSGLLNVSIQEYIIEEMLKALYKAQIVRLRYLPFLFGLENDMRIIDAFRIWEKRAKRWLSLGKELPKIVATKHKEGCQYFNDLPCICGLKKRKITVHFREGKYGDSEARDINPNYSQDLINAIRDKYPEYEIVRLGDSSMTLLDGCRNASHDNLSVAEQIREIQESALFIGSHSAPQMLALACSDTPIICINYTAQETTTEMEPDNIARMSYEPIGKQVRKIFYVKMYDENNEEIIPTQNNPRRKRIDYADISEIIAEISNVIPFKSEANKNE